MKSKFILTLSLITNLAFIVAIIIPGTHHEDNRVTINQRSDSIEQPNQEFGQLSLSNDTPGNPATNSAEFVNTWLKSGWTDYRELYRFLRNAGWSVELARAIVYASLNDRYGSRLASEIVRNDTWWQPRATQYTQEGQELIEKRRAEFNQASLALEAERTPMQEAELREQYGERLYSKAPEINSITTDYTHAFLSLIKTESATPGDKAGYREDTERKKENEIQSILTDEEYREWELRMSDSARNVMRKFSSFDLAFEQYEGLYDAIKEYDSKFRYLISDPSRATDEEIIQGKLKRNEAIARILGPEAVERVYPTSARSARIRAMDSEINR